MHLEALRALKLPSVRHEYSFKDSILYALGLGYGSNPSSTEELQFVYEGQLKAVPSMSVVLGYPGFWMQKPELGVDWVKLLHGEHYFEIHSPLQATGTLRAEHSVPAVEDKGADKGALVYIEKRLYDTSDACVATIRQTLFLRGDGGCGSYGTPPSPAQALPERQPDLTVDIPTLPQLALIYRLSGDYNPIHADPVIAKEAGFKQPILMGLCTMGIATRAAIHGLCDGNPDLIRSMFVRFSKPVIPGQTLRFQFFMEEGVAFFRALCVESGAVVLDRCAVRIGQP